MYSGLAAFSPDRVYEAEQVSVKRPAPAAHRRIRGTRKRLQLKRSRCTGFHSKRPQLEARCVSIREPEVHPTWRQGFPHLRMMEGPELGDVSVPAMSVVAVDSMASSSRDVRSRDRNATPPRRTPIVEEPGSDSTATLCMAHRCLLPTHLGT